MTRFLADGSDAGDRIGDTAAVVRFREDWQTLSGLGFEVILTDNAVQVFHPGKGFEFQVRVGSPVFDFQAMNRLFEDLRRHFGQPLERWLPWLFQANPAVTASFSLIKNIVLTADRVLGGRSVLASTTPPRSDDEPLGV